MIPLYSTKQIKELDDYAINKGGIPGLLLMENASINISGVIIEKLTSLKLGYKVGIICGKGNNGGDGFAVARHLSNYGCEVTIIALGKADELSPDSRMNYNILKNLYHTDITIINFSSIKDLKYLNKCDTIIDAVLGSGAKGPLKEPYMSIIKEINKLNAYKIAIDIPTGLDADKGYGDLIFKSNLTITLSGYKKGLFFNDGYAYSGEIVKKGIGVDEALLESYHTDDYLIEPEDAFVLLPHKEKDIYKYSAGKVLTIAGSVKLPGAAMLASKAVLNIGAGASVLAFPKVGNSLIAASLSEVIMDSYGGAEEYLIPEVISSLQKRIEWADVIAIGPGLGRSEATQEAVINIIRDNNSGKFVIDADAIFALKNGNYKKVKLNNSILTPHHAEFAELLGINIDELKKDLLNFGKQFAAETGGVLVLKGSPTIIFNPDGETFINSSGNPGLAKFGTGDVLTGVIAGLYAQVKNSEDAAICGVYLHSLTADLLKDKLTEYSYTAGDIINYMYESIKFLRKSFA
ncbi:MAG: NAD(P)H-hydrate dehydratase [Ignavibacteriaceae bacterium]|nr:NAD(P)H-hydrate dehydratase [Ignavibacteriaceae bacterium]